MNPGECWRGSHRPVLAAAHEIPLTAAPLQLRLPPPMNSRRPPPLHRLPRATSLRSVWCKARGATAVRSAAGLQPQPRLPAPLTQALQLLLQTVPAQPQQEGRKAFSPCLYVASKTRLRAHSSRVWTGHRRGKSAASEWHEAAQLHVCKLRSDGVSVCSLLGSAAQGSAFNLCVDPDCSALRHRSCIFLVTQAASRACARGTPSAGLCSQGLEARSRQEEGAACPGVQKKSRPRGSPAEVLRGSRQESSEAELCCRRG